MTVPSIPDMLRAFASLLFPKTCYGCEVPLASYEHMLCTSCYVGFPLTDYTFAKNNPVVEKLGSALPIENGTALCFFQKKGVTATLIYQLKYKNTPEIGTFLGEWLGQQLLESKLYEDVDVVIPVPLHPKRLRKRGYNQSAIIARAVANCLDKTYLEDVLLRVKNTQPLALADKNKRQEEVKDAFQIGLDGLSNSRHFLLIDDVITSGATLHACVQCLLQNPKNKVSIAALAFRM